MQQLDNVVKVNAPIHMLTHTDIYSPTQRERKFGRKAYKTFAH